MAVDHESFAGGDLVVVRGVFDAEWAGRLALQCNALVSEPAEHLTVETEHHGRPIDGLTFLTYPRTAIEALGMETISDVLDITGRPTDTLVNPNRYEVGAAGHLHEHPDIMAPVVIAQANKGFIGYDNGSGEQKVPVVGGDLVVINNVSLPHRGGNTGDTPHFSATFWRPTPFYDRAPAPFILKLADVATAEPTSLAA